MGSRAGLICPQTRRVFPVQVAISMYTKTDACSNEYTVADRYKLHNLRYNGVTASMEKRK